MDQDSLFRELLARLNLEWAGLPDKPQETADQTLRLLWRFAAGQLDNLDDKPADALPELDGQQFTRLEELVQQRCERVPLAYLIGRQRFMGIELLSGPEAMIPRLETEILGQAAITALRMLARKPGRVEVLDLCCGSGNLTLAMAQAEPNCRVTGVDLSADAVSLAVRNAARNGLEERVRFLESDLFAVFERESILPKFDLVTCNPPYISTAQIERMPLEIRAYEPHLAFDGGPFGIHVISRLLRDAPQFMNEGAFLCFEVGAGQGKVIENLLKRYKAFGTPSFYRDEQGQVRAVRLTRVAEN